MLGKNFIHNECEAWKTSNAHRYELRKLSVNRDQEVRLAQIFLFNEAVTKISWFRAISWDSSQILITPEAKSKALWLCLREIVILTLRTRWMVNWLCDLIFIHKKFCRVHHWLQWFSSVEFMDFTLYPHFVHGNELIEGARFSTVAQTWKREKL